MNTEIPSPEALAFAATIPWFDYIIARDKAFAIALDRFRAVGVEAAVEKERGRLGFGEIVMISEQRNKPGLASRWAALARGRKQASIADSEDEARVAALAIPVGEQP